LALAPEPPISPVSDPASALENARQLVAAAEAFRNPVDPDQLAKATGLDPVSPPSRDHIEAVQLEAFNASLAVAAEHATPAFHSEDGWLDSVRAGLVALLRFFDAEPDLARFLIVHSAQAGDRVLDRRADVLYRLSVLLDDERAPARTFPPPLTAQAVTAGALGVLQERISRRSSKPLALLSTELMSFIVLPFLGARASRRELDDRRNPTAVSADAATLEVVRDSAGRLSPRTVSVLLAIAADPGMNSRAVSVRAGVRDEGQASRLLLRLERLGLIENVRDPGSRFAPKSWCLTAAGRNVEASLAREASAPAAVRAYVLPEHFAALPDESIALLVALAGHPWLRTAEAAARASVPSRANPTRLLQCLADLGLAVAELESHTRGTPKVWSLTPAGEHLHTELTGTARERSVAADLMQASGGRLPAPQIAVLRVLGAEPGLSNNDLAGRLNLSDENTTSQLLARLERRGLIVNARISGRSNVWHLTPAGEMLERAVWAETPAADQREIALDSLRDRGGRLNHRVVAVLRAIGASPGLGNAELADTVGIASGAKAHTSALLARLSRFGLIENAVVDPAPFESNAWHLTAFGRLFDAATRDVARPASPRSSRSKRRATAKGCA